MLRAVALLTAEERQQLRDYLDQIPDKTPLPASEARRFCSYAISHIEDSLQISIELTRDSPRV